MVFPVSSTEINDIGFIDFKDPWLQDLLWNTVSPTQIFQREGYTKMDMMGYFKSMVDAGCYSFLGSKKAGTVLRCYFPNPYVVEPHIVGNGGYIRLLLKVGTDFTFSSTKVSKINIYTHLPSIKNIVSRLGFIHEGTTTNSYLLDGDLKDIFILGLSKQDYYKHETFKLAA